jgi:hypothetical protein
MWALQAHRKRRHGDLRHLLCTTQQHAGYRSHTDIPKCWHKLKWRNERIGPDLITAELHSDEQHLHRDKQLQHISSRFAPGLSSARDLHPSAWKINTSIYVHVRPERSRSKELLLNRVEVGGPDLVLPSLCSCRVFLAKQMPQRGRDKRCRKPAYIVTRSPDLHFTPLRTTCERCAQPKKDRGMMRSQSRTCKNEAMRLCCFTRWQSRQGCRLYCCVTYHTRLSRSLRRLDT